MFEKSADNADGGRLSLVEARCQLDSELFGHEDGPHEWTDHRPSPGNPSNVLIFASAARLDLRDFWSKDAKRAKAKKKRKKP